MSEKNRAIVSLQIKKLFAAYPRVTASEETMAAWLDAFARLEPHEVQYAVGWWLENGDHFPGPGEINKLARSIRRATTDAFTTARMLEDKEAPKFLRRTNAEDSKEAKAARYRQLRKYPSVLARHSDRENW
jgi:hypothetical protein